MTGDNGVPGQLRITEDSRQAREVLCVLPCRQKKPWSHAPVHSGLSSRARSPYLPAAQSVGVSDPSGQEWPIQHGLHCAALVKSVALEYLPDAHGIGDAEPSMQKYPGVQSRQFVMPRAGWCFPGEHCAHVSAPLSRATLPG